MISVAAYATSRGRTSRAVSAQFLVTIRNFWELRHVFGAGLVQNLPAILQARACAAGIAKRGPLHLDGNRFVLISSAALSNRKDSVLCLLELVLLTLGGAPVQYGPWSVLVGLEIEAVGEGGRTQNLDNVRAAHDLQVASQLRQDDGWRDAYAAAMNRASRLYSKLAAGDLAFAFQLIVDCSNPERRLYQEALLRVLRACGEARSAGGALASLERLRLIRHIDYCTVKAILALLVDRPELNLGCNISAESAVADAWWATVFQQLEADPRLARRLVIEITESARIPDIAAALTFIQRLREFGCRIAIDDFGLGFTPLDFVVRARPDVIKIGRDYLQRGRECEKAREVFHNLASLAASIANDVVVEGVETGEDLRLIEESPIGNRGNVWAQGWFSGRPTLLPAWHASSPCVLAAPAPNPFASVV